MKITIENDNSSSIKSNNALCWSIWEPIDVAIQLDIVLDELAMRLPFERAQEIIAKVCKELSEHNESGVVFNGEEDVRKEILKALEVEDERDDIER